MFSNVKNKIKELAKKAVFFAEAELGSGKGQEKKAMAIAYIVNRLPFPPVFSYPCRMELGSELQRHFSSEGAVGCERPGELYVALECAEQQGRLGQGSE